MKKILTFFLTAALVIVFAACSSDDDFLETSGTIYGNVTEKATGTPIGNATVTLSPSGKTMTSGADGYYQFDNLEEGTYTVTVFKEGYATNRVSVSVVSGEKAKADIPLDK